MTKSKLKDKNLITQILSKHKSSIDTYLEQILEEDQTTFSVHSWSEETFCYLKKFVLSGKTIRGSLLLEIATQLKINKPLSLLPLAAMVELVHSGLLIHDDIMDRDKNRRGMNTMHTVFTDTAIQQKYAKPSHFGLSMAICAGDVAFFLGLAELSKVDLSAKTINKLQNYAMKEYVHVGFAQMKDVEFGHSNGQFLLDEIITVYLYKTARYTFSLPLVLAGISANLEQKSIDDLEQIGELIGVMFQIRDDYLGLFGNTSKTGKPIGTDVIENKKTIYRHFLFQQAILTSKHQDVSSLFGKEILSEKEISQLQKVIVELGIDQKVNQITNIYLQELELCLSTSKLDSQLKNILKATGEYVLNREK